MEPSNTLLVSKLPENINESRIREIFGEFGHIQRCYVTPSYEQKKLRLAYVTFKKLADAVNAQETLSTRSIDGKSLVIKFTKHKEKNKPQREGKQPKVIKKDFNRKARLIVRNISFKACEDDLTNIFSQHGEIVEVKVLKKPNGDLVGCAFVQFRRVPDASNAIKSCNGNLLHNRNIIVDWAVPKYQYQNASEKSNSEVAVKKECGEDENPVIKVEHGSDSEDETSFDYSKVKIKEEVQSSDSENEENNSLVKNEHCDDESESEDDNKMDKEERLNKQNQKLSDHRPAVSKDIRQMKTVFVRNVPFDASEEELTELMTQYGPVKYSLLCHDRVTEHPKGTAFVQFLDKKSVDRCLESSAQGLLFNGRTIQVFRAVSRSEVPVSKPNDTKMKTDSRNLYLAKEGQISAGSPAIEGVSQGDIQKRAMLDLYKKKILKNLHMFVSDKRLCVHNIPPSLTDAELRKIFLKYAPKNAKITEARIMRDRKKLDENSMGQSKEFGFVSFKLHEDALMALRNINNNPHIFRDDKRPIVEFSIENKVALLAKERRTEKSKLMNPNTKKKNEESGGKQRQVKTPTSRPIDAEYVGFQSDSQKKVPISLKIRTKPRYAEVKQAKAAKKLLKSKATKRKHHLPQENGTYHTKDVSSEPKNKKQKTRKSVKDDKFTNLVESYKKKFMSISDESRKKWFDG